ncbi:hypothetical protein CRG98_027362 [Punica granatum]|uniref:Uncharacterized protein n=1 Tax=Punica granatum TaxID=22663 RepID=A0A2I0J7N5_PUNGR|nr:hypothetical protein CRG98_027362 [Punica granatum]
MARRAMTKGRSSQLPTPHDRRVMPTFAGRSPAAFTLPPWQGEPWTEGRPTFPAPWNFNTEFPSPFHKDCKQIRVTALQRPALFLSIDLCLCISCTFLSGLHLQLLGFGPAFTAFGLWPRIGLRPRIRLQPCMGFGLASGFGPAFTTLGFGPASGFGPALGFGLASGFDSAFTTLGFGPAFTTLGFGPASGFGPALGFDLASGFGSAFTTLGFGPASGFGLAWISALHWASAPHLQHWASAPHRVSALHGFWPCIGLRPRIYNIGLRPRIELRPCMDFSLALGFDPALGIDPAFIASGFGPASGFGLALSFDPALGFGSAFTALGFSHASSFGLAWALASHWASTPHPHLLLSGFGPAFIVFGLRLNFTASKF